jgi:hypothetical protein
MSNNSLKTQLKEKEELVAALTERLELAAEQLDRFQRSGANQNVRSSAGGFSPELIERHESLVDEMHLAVQQWNDMQAGAALGNLETQVSELRDLVSPNSSGSRQPRWQDRLIQSGDVQSETFDDEVETSGGDESATEQGNHWEALKSHLMGADDEPAENTTRPAANDAGDAGSIEDDGVKPDHPASAPDEFADPPQPIDADETDVTILQGAVSERDEYIGFLIRKLRDVSSPTYLPADWAEWEASPEELCRQVEELQSQLTESLRLSELEHSLERARLGREEARVRQMEEAVRKTLRQLGLDPDFDGDEEVEFERDAGTGNRWLRMLGICRDDDDDCDDDADDD